jgi:hypothetical protein
MKMFRLTIGMVGAKIVLLTSISLMVLLTSMIINALGGDNTGGIIPAMAPLAAFIVLRLLLKNLGFGNITSVTGALGMATAGAAAMTGDRGTAKAIGGQFDAAAKEGKKALGAPKRAYDGANARRRHILQNQVNKSRRADDKDKRANRAFDNQLAEAQALGDSKKLRDLAEVAPNAVMKQKANQMADELDSKRSQAADKDKTDSSKRQLDAIHRHTGEVHQVVDGNNPLGTQEGRNALGALVGGTDDPAVAAAALRANGIDPSGMNPQKNQLSASDALELEAGSADQMAAELSDGKTDAVKAAAERHVANMEASGKAASEATKGMLVASDLAGTLSRGAEMECDLPAGSLLPSSFGVPALAITNGGGAVPTAVDFKSQVQNLSGSERAKLAPAYLSSIPAEAALPFPDDISGVAAALVAETHISPEAAMEAAKQSAAAHPWVRLRYVLDGQTHTVNPIELQLGGALGDIEPARLVAEMEAISMTGVSPSASQLSQTIEARIGSNRESWRAQVEEGARAFVGRHGSTQSDGGAMQLRLLYDDACARTTTMNLEVKAIDSLIASGAPTDEIRQKLLEFSTIAAPTMALAVQQANLASGAATIAMNPVEHVSASPFVEVAVQAGNQTQAELEDIIKLQMRALPAAPTREAVELVWEKTREAIAERMDQQATLLVEVQPTITAGFQAINTRSLQGQTVIPIEGSRLAPKS